jgi:hypothetical protein
MSGNLVLRHDGEQRTAWKTSGHAIPVCDCSNEDEDEGDV